MKTMFAIVGLMALYLALATGLVLKIDQRFLFNDALAAAFFVALLIALPLMGERRRRR